MDQLELRFGEELIGKMIRAKKECKYNPTRFNQMLAKYGGVETAKRLIANSISSGLPSDGFTTLRYVCDRPDLTVEHSVCKPEYAPLFSEEEINWCRSILNI